MTVQELIDELQEIKDKSKEVKFLDWNNSKQDIDFLAEYDDFILLT